MSNRNTRSAPAERRRPRPFSDRPAMVATAIMQIVADVRHAELRLRIPLRHPEPCTRCGEPTPPLDGRVICVRCAPVLWGCGGTERGQ